MRQTRAFTLLELLLATALTTVLLAGVLAVLVRVGGPLRVGQGPTDDGLLTEIDRLVLLLRDDLASAREVDGAGENALTIVTYAAIDPQDSARSHRPVRVTYELRQAADRPWLIRRQERLDIASSRNVQRQIVCGGFTRFEVIHHEGQQPTLVSSTQTPENDAAGPAASRWSLRLWTDDTRPPTERPVAITGALAP